MPKIPLSRSLTWILLSVLTISGPAFLCLLYYQSIVDKQKKDPAYTLTHLDLHCSQRDALPPDYFQELLNFSVDHPMNLHTLHHVEEQLLTSPVIRDVQVEKVFPHTLSISYSMPNPIAHVIDYENTAIDSEGVIFPLQPFYLQKRLPELYLGLAPYGQVEGGTWGMPLIGPRKELALDLLRLVSREICSPDTRLKRIDVSHAFAPSLGKRQIVIILEERTSPEPTTNILRLSPKNYSQELAHYKKLRPHLNEAAEHVIEMRIPQLAYIREGELTEKRFGRL